DVCSSDLVTGVGDLDIDLDVAIDLAEPLLGDLPVEVRVAQSVAEGVDDGVVVVNEPFLGGGLVVAVPGINALLVVDEVGTVDVRVGVIAEILESRIRGEVGGPDVDGVPGGVDLAAEDRAECRESYGTGRSDLQDCVDG